MSDELREVSIESISVNPFQPRKQFAEEEIVELAESIKSLGLIQPPIVRPIGKEPEKFELIAGERRLRAAVKAGLEKISVLVRLSSNHYSAEAALIENIQRIDLDPIEIAKAIQQLMESLRLTQEQIAVKVGKKRSTVANYLRLLLLPRSIQESISKGEITMGHAKVILSLEIPQQRLYLHEQILKQQLTVREAEKSASKLLGKSSEAFHEKTRNFYLEELVERLQQRFGTKVDITERDSRSGRILIDYFSLDDLDRLLDILLERKDESERK